MVPRKLFLWAANYGFNEENVTVMTDSTGSSNLPTGENIKNGISDMVKNAKAGDILLFYFSGHGTLVPAKVECGKVYREHEAIMPCDLNLITDEDFRYSVNQLPEGVTFTVVSDSCHSGGLIDQEKEQIGPNIKQLLDTTRRKGVASESKELVYG